MSSFKVSKLLASCVVAVAITAGASSVSAQNKGGDSALLQQMMRQRMEAMKNPETMKMMGKENLHMMVMDQMAHQMAADPEFQKMHAEMMKDPECMKMMEGCKVAMKDEAKMSEMHDQIKNDPKMMEAVMNKAMMMDMAKSDPDTMKTMDHSKMDHSTMAH